MGLLLLDHTAHKSGLNACGLGLASTEPLDGALPSVRAARSVTDDRRLVSLSTVMLVLFKLLQETDHLVAAFTQSLIHRRMILIVRVVLEGDLHYTIFWLEGASASEDHAVTGVSLLTVRTHLVAKSALFLVRV